MSADPLIITRKPKQDNRITSFEFHSYNPYVNSSLNYNDEIRIPIQQQDLVILPSQSYLYVELTVKEQRPADLPAGRNVYVNNNVVAFMFDEIRYELNGVEIDRCKNAGITTSLKNYVSLTEDQDKKLKQAGWSDELTKVEISKNFNFCVPLSMIMGFFEDYKKVIANARHEIILIRSRDDINCLVKDHVDIQTWIKLTKIQWRVPHVTLDEYTKLEFLQILQQDRAITMSFRSWDLYEYPLLPQTSTHTWSVKTSTQLEKPRYVIVALQTNRKNVWSEKVQIFNHCKLRNIKLFLNSESYPYDNFNLDVDSDREYSIIYSMYKRFINSYYDVSERTVPALNITNFKLVGPLYVIDCSRQNESIKGGTVDLRIEFECAENVPANTCAYCLVLHDRVVEYNPLTSIVHKLI